MADTFTGTFSQGTLAVVGRLQGAQFPLAILRVAGSGNQSWNAYLGTPQPSGNTTWTLAQATIASGPDFPGSLSQRDDGVVEFMYRNSSNQNVIVRADLLPNGTGTWT